ncbi:MAG: hypothetical protein ACT4P1_09110 [Sporichthyaceae bacterium]
MSANDEYAHYPEPRPGAGTVFVMRLNRTQWEASWQEGPGVRGLDGRKAVVLAWARAQPAAGHVVFDWRDDAYKPLPMSGPVDVGLPRRQWNAENAVYSDVEYNNEGPGWFGQPPETR